MMKTILGERGKGERRKGRGGGVENRKKGRGGGGLSCGRDEQRIDSEKERKEGRTGTRQQ